MRAPSEPRRCCPLAFDALQRAVAKAAQVTNDALLTVRLRDVGTLDRSTVDMRRVVVEITDSCGGLPEGSERKLYGQVRMHSLPGKGCVFVLDLPAMPAEPLESSQVRDSK